MEENETDQMDMICQACITKHPFLVYYDGQRETELFDLFLQRFSSLVESRQPLSAESNAGNYS